MENATAAQSPATSAWNAKQVYAMAVVSLVIGLAIGYLFRGSQSPAPPPQPVASQPPAAPGAMGAPAGQMPSLDDMKKMADMKAAPLLDKLKSDPTNADLLQQVGNIYLSTHQFKVAADYFDKALQVNPKNVALRTEMASCLYYGGDVDGAINQVEQSLKYDPKDANSLFNLGMMRLQGKQDVKGALDAWQRLLKTNPDLSPDRKARVEKLVADLQMHSKDLALSQKSEGAAK